MTRKQSRFAYWLVWCFLATYSTAWAQAFDPVTIGANLDTEVASGAVTNAQFSALQQAEIEAFLATDQAQNYYQLNFDPDGAYGELKNGSVVDDWESLAKAMGTTGAVLAGGYAVWRQRRKEELSLLRGGDTEAIEKLFESDFIDQEATAQNTNGSTVFHEDHIPKTAEQWEEWGKTKGLPGVGASLAALFLIWRRKQGAEGTNQNTPFQELYESQYDAGENYRTFYYDVSREVSQKIQAEKDALLAGLERPDLNKRFGIVPRQHLWHRFWVVS